MSVYVEINNNTIINIVRCDTTFANTVGLVDISTLSVAAGQVGSPGIGWTFDGTAWNPPAIPTTQQNRSTLQQRASTALTNNATYLAIATPTTLQAVAQVQALTRQINGVIRLLINQLDSVSDA